MLNKLIQLIQFCLHDKIDHDSSELFKKPCIVMNHKVTWNFSFSIKRSTNYWQWFCRLHYYNYALNPTKCPISCCTWPSHTFHIPNKASKLFHMLPSLGTNHTTSGPNEAHFPAITQYVPSTRSQNVQHFWWCNPHTRERRAKKLTT